MPGASKIRVVIADDLKLQREMLKSAFGESDRFELVGEAATGAELVQIAKREIPDLVLTDLNMPVLDGAQALRILSFSIPQCVFVVFSGEEDIEKLKPLITAGASDFLRKPLDMGKLMQSVARIYEREAPRKRTVHDASPDEGGKVLTVVGAQAGGGATTWAVNLAVALGKQSGGRTVLLDFDFQTAAATHRMSAAGERGMLDFFQETEAVSYEALQAFLVERHGIWMLPGAPFPIDGARRDNEVLTAILAALSPHFDYVVVDLEPRMDEANQLVLGRSDRVYFVASNEAANLRAAGRWMAVYNYSKPPEGKCRVVYNHAWSESKIPRQQVTEILGLELLGEVVHDGASAQVATWEGKPVILDADAAMSKSMRMLCEKILSIGA